MSYCISAEDWRGLGRVVDRVLDEYTTSGKGSELFFVLLFNYVYYYRVTSIHQLRSRNSSFSSRAPNSIFSSRHFCSSSDICSSVCQISPAH